MLALLAALIASPVSTEIVLPAEPVPLAGTLVEPDGPTRAAVVFVPKWDEPNADGFWSFDYVASDRMFMAEEFSRLGVASLRYFPRSSSGDEVSATMPDYDLNRRDGVEWASHIAERVGTPCVWLFSTSESTLISHAIAQSSDKICGMIVVAPILQTTLERDIYSLTTMPTPLAASVGATIDDMTNEFIEALKREHPDWETNPEIKKAIAEITELEKTATVDPEFQAALAREKTTRDQYLEVLEANAEGRIIEVNDPDIGAIYPAELQRHNIQANRFNRSAALANATLPMLVIINEINEVPVVDAATAYEPLPSAAVRVFKHAYPTNMLVDTPAPAHLLRVPEGQFYQTVADFILMPR